MRFLILFQWFLSHVSLLKRVAKNNFEIKKTSTENLYKSAVSGKLVNFQIVQSKPGNVIEIVLIFIEVMES